MFRATTLVSCLIATVALVGCGRSASPLAAGQATGISQAQNVLHFHVPKNRLLAANEQNADFDKGLALAAHEGTAWDPSPKLFWAFHSPAHPGRGGTVAPARFVYAYTAGIDALVEMVAPQTLTFHMKPHLLEALFVGTIDTKRLITGATALSAARATGKIKNDDPAMLLVRYHTQKNAMFTIMDSASAAPSDPTAGPTKPGAVTVDAYTGQVVGDSKVMADATAAAQAIGAETESDAPQDPTPTALN